MRLHSVGFHDSIGDQAKHKLPTLFDFESSIRWDVDNRDLGLDIGMIHLSPLTRAGLEANDIVPVREVDWISQPETCDAYFLFGAPEELVTEPKLVTGAFGKAMNITVHSVLLPVTKSDKPHREIPPSTFPWFIGTVYIPDDLKSIKGMSGGPIFGFKKLANGEERYWVVALQSWWDPNTKTVYGCPVPIFAGLTQDFLQSMAERKG